MISAIGPLTGNTYQFQIVANVWGNAIVTPETRSRYNGYISEAYLSQNMKRLIRDAKRNAPREHHNSSIPTIIPLTFEPVAFDPGPTAVVASFDVGGDNALPGEILPVSYAFQEIFTGDCRGDYDCFDITASATLVGTSLTGDIAAFNVSMSMPQSGSETTRFQGDILSTPENMPVTQPARPPHSGEVVGNFNISPGNYFGTSVIVPYGQNQFLNFYNEPKYSDRGGNIHSGFNYQIQLP